MAACRGLDVLMGAGRDGAARALPRPPSSPPTPASTTTVSRREVEGGTPRLPRLAARGDRAWSRPRRAVGGAARRAPAARLAAAAGLVGAYAATVGGAHAARDPATPRPSGCSMRSAPSVLGLMPLEAGMLADAGGLAPAGGIAALWPLARSLPAGGR